MKPSIPTPRLSRVCLLAFAIALGFFLNQLRTHGAFDLAFLVTGALGCIYLLLLASEHHTAQQRYHSMPARLRDIECGALPLKHATTERAQARPPHAPERRKPGSRAYWPRHLERRKTARLPHAAAG